ncbi:hypothetical protein XELAEV_18041523mg [Xenopus laevis]|uniref:Uncharacterized protein n=1 Tax=Xenopus laevis TaxID=8355 RepID=A0A974H565_XENLA|nr:hypothetical protein XELAEV_18041523mg [Xenopus laevis]
MPINMWCLSQERNTSNQYVVPVSMPINTCFTSQEKIPINTWCPSQERWPMNTYMRTILVLRYMAALFRPRLACVSSGKWQRGSCKIPQTVTN